MKINPRVLINKKTGKIYFNRFMPSPLQEIEKELVFDMDLMHQFHKALQLLMRFSSFLKENDFSRYEVLFRKIEAYYSLIGSSIHLEPVDIFTGNNDLLNLYINASDFALENYKRLSFLDLNKHINELLVSDSLMRPGDLRKTKFVKNIVHFPVDPKDIKPTMSVLANYFEENSNRNFLIRAALIYYQFLTISPFQAANHRQAKILLLTYFKKNNVFKDFPFSLSYYFSKSIKDYHDLLIDVRCKGNYLYWIEYFLIGIEKTTYYSLKVLEEIITLKTKNVIKINQSNYSRTIKNNLLQLLDYLSINPTIEIKQICLYFSKSYPTIASCIEALQEMEIIFPLNENRRNRSYQYRDYFNILFSINN